MFTVLVTAVLTAATGISVIRTIANWRGLAPTRPANAADSFDPGFTYEWEVRTYNSSGGPASDWSDPFAFYAIGTYTTCRQTRPYLLQHVTT